MRCATIRKYSLCQIFKNLKEKSYFIRFLYFIRIYWLSELCWFVCWCAESSSSPEVSECSSPCYNCYICCIIKYINIIDNIECNVMFSVWKWYLPSVYRSVSQYLHQFHGQMGLYRVCVWSEVWTQGLVWLIDTNIMSQDRSGADMPNILSVIYN